MKYSRSKMQYEPWHLLPNSKRGSPQQVTMEHLAQKHQPLMKRRLHHSLTQPQVRPGPRCGDAGGLDVFWRTSPVQEGESTDLVGKECSALSNIGKISARSLRCIPATSSPSERLFSAVGNIASKKRASLSPEHVNMLTFLHCNQILL